MRLLAPLVLLLVLLLVSLLVSLVLLLVLLVVLVLVLDEDVRCTGRLQLRVFSSRLLGLTSDSRAEAECAEWRKFSNWLIRRREVPTVSPRSHPRLRTRRWSINVYMAH